MEDLLYILVMVALVAVAAAFVVGCDKIIGPDDVALAEQGPDEDDLGAPAHTEVAA
jgi:hypothetical protein